MKTTTHIVYEILGPTKSDIYYTLELAKLDLGAIKEQWTPEFSSGWAEVRREWDLGFTGEVDCRPTTFQIVERALIVPECTNI